MWCIAKITPEYRKRIYDLIKLYGRKYDPKRPIICMDEKSKQSLADSRTSLPAKPGQIFKQDYEYIRKGSRNIFVAVEPKGGKRITAVTLRRTKQDFAKFMEKLTKSYPNAEILIIVLDNLNIHFPTSFFETFSTTKANRLLKKIEFHYTPKHASWLNMAEIEIGIFDAQCLGGRRIANEEKLIKEVKALTAYRNHHKKQIHWTFTKKKADVKLSKYYVS